MGLLRESGQVKPLRVLSVYLVSVVRRVGFTVVNDCPPSASVKPLTRGRWFGKFHHEFACVRALKKPAKGLWDDVETFADIFVSFQSTSGQPC